MSDRNGARWGAASRGAALHLGTICLEVQKSARTARRYADAWNYIIIIVLIYCTFIARLSRRGSYAFFSWWRSWELWESKMDTATPSYGPPWGYWISKEKRRLWKSKPPLHGRMEICLLYDGFFSFAVVRQSLLLNYATSTRTGKRLFLLQLAGSFKEIAYTVLICNG